MVVIRKVNESYLQVDADPGIVRELSEVLTFEVPNAHHMRRMMEKRGRKMYSNWDGRIKLLDYRNGAAYLGLHRFIRQYCEENNYEVSYEDGIDGETPFSLWEARKFFKSLNLTVQGQPVDVRDYQERAFVHGIQRRRAILVSPTASGKSLIIYLMLRYLQNRLGIDPPGKLLVIVPTTSLVEQMYSDFADYSAADPTWNVEENCHRVHSGADRDTDLQITITLERAGVGILGTTQADGSGFWNLFLPGEVRATVERLRSLSPLWDMHCAGIDLDTIQWSAH